MLCTWNSWEKNSRKSFLPWNFNTLFHCHLTLTNTSEKLGVNHILILCKFFKFLHCARSSQISWWCIKSCIFSTYYAWHSDLYKSICLCHLFVWIFVPSNIKMTISLPFFKLSHLICLICSIITVWMS